MSNLSSSAFMSQSQLTEALAKLALSPSGTKQVLTKRLNNYYKSEQLSAADAGVKFSPFYLALDFDASCIGVNNPAYYPHEIIHFAAALVSSEDKKVAATFESYVRPDVEPILPKFCVGLTYVTQDAVNKAPSFEEVLKNFEEWMKNNDLGAEGKEFIIVTDGPWDLAKFFHTQCMLSNVTYPQWAEKWCNLRNAFRKVYSVNVKQCNLKGMIQELGLAPQGRSYCHLDDYLDIAQVIVTLIKDQVPMSINERIALEHYGYPQRRNHLLQAAVDIVAKRTDKAASEILNRLKLAQTETPSPRTQTKLEYGVDSIVFTNGKFGPRG